MNPELLLNRVTGLATVASLAAFALTSCAGSTGNKERPGPNEATPPVVQFIPDAIGIQCSEISAMPSEPVYRPDGTSAYERFTVTAIGSGFTHQRVMIQRLQKGGRSGGKEDSRTLPVDHHSVALRKNASYLLGVRVTAPNGRAKQCPPDKLFVDSSGRGRLVN